MHKLGQANKWYVRHRIQFHFVSRIDRQSSGVTRINGIRGEDHRRGRGIHVRRDVWGGDTRMRSHCWRYWVGRNVTCSQVGRYAVLNVVLYEGMRRYV